MLLGVHGESKSAMSVLMSWCLSIQTCLEFWNKFCCYKSSGNKTRFEHQLLSVNVHGCKTLDVDRVRKRGKRGVHDFASVLEL